MRKRRAGGARPILVSLKSELLGIAKVMHPRSLGERQMSWEGVEGCPYVANFSSRVEDDRGSEVGEVVLGIKCERMET